MKRRSTLPSGIGMALQQHEDTPKAGNTVDAGEKRYLLPRGSRDRSVLEARMSAQWEINVDSAAKSVSAINVDGTERPNSHTASLTMNSVFNNFCRGQPPRRSFLDPDGRTPPQLRMSRRSTLADKPELDTLLKAAMVQYKDEEFLPLDSNTMHRLTQYVNGSKPLANASLCKRLLINSETNKVCVVVFITALEHIGLYCEHLAIVAPFHPNEFSHVSDGETGNPEPGSGWEKILECFPNLHNLTVKDTVEEPTHPTRDTFDSLNYALANNATFHKYLEIELDGPCELIFDCHYDYHSRRRLSDSPRSFSVVSTPLTMIGSDTISADDAQVFGSLDDDSIFGKADDIDVVDG